MRLCAFRGDLKAADMFFQQKKRTRQGRGNMRATASRLFLTKSLPRHQYMDQKTIDTYNQMADVYDEETKTFWERFPRTFLDEFSNRVGQKILDIGSGPGRDALLLKKEGREVICLDASEAMISLTKAKGFESVQGDFLDLPFDDESFDGVWSYTTLLHVPKEKISIALKEIKRVIKQGGLFGLGMIEGDSEGHRDSLANKPRYFAYYNKEELEILIKLLGFEVIYFETFKPSSKNYLNFIFRKI